MEIFHIAFIGHRMILGAPNLEDELEQIIREYIKSKEYLELYVGRNGDFDISVASAAKRAQKALGNHNSSLILVQPYPMKNDPDYTEFYDEIYYPVDGRTHPKAAIAQRNRWMVDHADLLVAYVEKQRAGGAATTLKYADKNGKRIINLAIKG